MGMTVQCGGNGNVAGNGKGVSNKGASTTKRIRVSSQAIRSGTGEKESGGSESGDGSDGSAESGSKSNGRRKKADQQLEVQVTFVEISDEERDERLNKITEALIDSVLRELNVPNRILTRNEDKLQ